MSDKMTIDSYDQNAEKWAKRQKQGSNLAHEYLEKPAMYSKLPDLKGLSVLCLGCGSGEECQKLKDLGAKRVVGIDASRGLIEQARYSYPEVEFEVMDMERLDFPEKCFDFVYSSLAIHYVENWRNVFNPLHKVLKSQGKVLISTHHPVRWGADYLKEKDKRTLLLGYTFYEKGGHQVFGDYLSSRKITDNLMEDLKVTYFHKSFSEMFLEIRESGFEIIDLLEPVPEEGAKAQKKDFFEVHQKIPLFVIFELAKKVSDKTSS